MLEFIQSDWIFITGAYLVVTIIVAIEADKKGWWGPGVFIVSLMATPLIAAILYSPYKKQEAASEKKEEEKDLTLNIEKYRL